MTPRWTASASKHGIPRADAAYAIAHATFIGHPDPDDGSIMLYIGPEHAQTDRELEILVRDRSTEGREWLIYHVMPLGPLYRRYREENPHAEK